MLHVRELHNIKARHEEIKCAVHDKVLEVKAFCDAFVETCPETLKTNLFTHISQLKIDYTDYCKNAKERFEYVCPEPLRFRTFAEDAVEFCLRYTNRCPRAKVPDVPVPFRKQDETHIYIREIAAHCKLYYRQARTFCLHLELLKFPKYAIPCWLYKLNCIDVYKKVIYDVRYGSFFDYSFGAAKVGNLLV
ncbi:unnamed protein product [Angiostrongylus costaricensis]|uniref:Uncharacterized protein n=1 Tax=Angiostrongylus costaricensis TaxID=334426 RepID=A0A0R3PEM9_ANGCS|nr:unnamed protein product [Angiostrongylus costaricensis]